MSVVRETRTSRPDRVMSATFDSGLDLVMECMSSPRRLTERALFVLFMWRLFVECRLPNYFINYNARRGRDLNLK